MMFPAPLPTALQFLAFVWVIVPILAFPALPPNFGAIVNLRIEGATKTIFEGPIFTRGHNVTTAAGGTHHCDGTNDGANPKPGPTCTSALDDAAKQRHFTYDGIFIPPFDDWSITRIDTDAQASTQFWGILLNFQYTPNGGCVAQVKPFDEVLWAFDPFTKAHFLKLGGPVIAKFKKPVTFTVTDGQNGTPISGATVVSSGSEAGQQVSDASGKATFTFTKRGAHILKANRADSIRSNAVVVVVI